MYNEAIGTVMYGQYKTRPTAIILAFYMCKRFGDKGTWANE